MARNWEKYMYVELAMLRSSAWYPLLEAEAAVKGQPLAQIVLEHLATFYLNQAAMAGRPLTQPPLASKTGQAVAAPANEEPEPQLSEEQATTNAATFLDNVGFF
jgi:hypothetical protein